MAWCTYLRNETWYTNNSPFTSYTTVTPHSDSQSIDVTSHVQYTEVIVCVLRVLLSFQLMFTCVTLFTVDKLMSGSSLGGKEATKL